MWRRHAQSVTTAQCTLPVATHSERESSIGCMNMKPGLQPHASLPPAYTLCAERNVCLWVCWGWLAPPGATKNRGGTQLGVPPNASKVQAQKHVIRKAAVAAAHECVRHTTCSTHPLLDMPDHRHGTQVPDNAAACFIASAVYAAVVVVCVLQCQTP